MILSDKAYAKINISLDIIEKMSNGYHSLKTIMQSINLYDDITIKCTKGAGIKINTDVPYIPDDERNIAVKTTKAFYEYTGITGYHTNIKISKNIPICAGLGGGSADAACVLRILNILHKTELSTKTLEDIGASVGSDVPFCVSGGTKLSEGRGEILTDLPSTPHCYVVVCKPPFSLSTPEVFSKVDVKKIRMKPDTDGILKALELGELKSIARRMYNVFEDIITRGKIEIETIKGTLLDNGALSALMTGSGPTVYGIFDEINKAQNAYSHLRGSYKECFLTETI
ncbi:MAG: 4-(cytidine 5'-diphospho)-2-C-methyl-D-erythritol kinase [Oscillospiraceae bacterium]|nr:4-(cytidine 5'-diphospho)-2-C-methyl-D-erythritol kinase [Oscillospiraceae bacterium]